MKKLLCLVVLALFSAVRPLAAHPHSMPRVDVTINLSETQLVYTVNLATMIMKPLAHLEVGKKYPELAEVSKGVQDFLAESCPVVIDGIAVRPVLKTITFSPAGDAIDQYPPGMEVDPAMQAEMAGSSWLDTCITYVYSLKDTPKKVSMIWNLFAFDAVRNCGMFGPREMFDSPEFFETPTTPDPTGFNDGSLAGNLKEVVAIFNAFGQKSFITYTPKEPEFVWHAGAKVAARSPAMTAVPSAAKRMLRIPVIPLAAGILLLLLLPAARAGKISAKFAFPAIVVILLAGIGASNVLYVNMRPFWEGGIKVPEQAQAKEIFDALHKNVYRAFDYNTEDDIYDALAQSVVGELLDEVYNDVHQGLILRDQGGAVCKIEKVEVLESAMEKDSEKTVKGQVSFDMNCRWRVLGIVEHWGHAHRRLNEYSALYTMVPVGDTWKIAKVKMRDQKRITGEKK